MDWGSVLCQPSIKSYRQRIIDLISLPLIDVLGRPQGTVNIKFMYTLLLQYYLMTIVIIMIHLCFHLSTFSVTMKYTKIL